MRVNCRLLSAERLVNFLTELRSDVPEAPRDDFMFAFREVLMNAMEHGGGFDPDQVVEVTAVRTARTMVFYLRDPGPGFDIAALRHAAVTRPDDPLAVAEVRARERPAPRRLRPPDHAADRGRDDLQRARQRGHPDQAPAAERWRSEWLRRRVRPGL